MQKSPNYITKLQPDEIFVFGSNLAGMHGGGAARLLNSSSSEQSFFNIQSNSKLLHIPYPQYLLFI